MATVKLTPYKFFIEDIKGEIEKSSIEKRLTLGKKIEWNGCESKIHDILHEYLSKDLSIPFSNDSNETLVKSSHPTTGKVNISTKKIKKDKAIVGEAIYGVLYTGKYGVASEIVGKNGGEHKYSKSTDDADVIPLYFNIFIPYNRLEGLCIIQNYGQYSLKRSFEGLVSSIVKQSKSSYKFKMINFAPKDEIASQLEKGDLVKVKTTKYFEKMLSEDKLDSAHGGMKVVEDSEVYGSILDCKALDKVYHLTKSGKKNLKNGLLDALKNEKLISEVIEFNDDYDVIKFEYKIQSSSKTLDFEKKEKFRCSRDISHVNLDANKHPLFDEIHEEGEEMLNEFKQYISL